MHNTDRHCSQQSLGYVGDNNSDEEDDGIQPIIAEYEGNDKERHSKEDSYTSDEMNEVLDLT